jgi:two-component system, chemotaxis family, CheB/CheR fusion protein
MAVNDADAPSSAASAAGDSPGEQMYVVGIGASAGGLGALQALLRSMPANPGFACVIVVHLSPEHESLLPELLQSQTSMLVHQVSATVPLERNQIYVIPPNANLDAIDTHLRLTELEERRIERAPINHFLRTLASTHVGTAIGVILTGGGSDGSLGLRHIKECGGLTIAQDPQEAEFDSMPRSAIATGMIDLVLPLRRIPEQIVRFCATQPQLPVPGDNDELETRDEHLLAQILAEVDRRTLLDFRPYRRATLLRRLRRRMQLCQVTSFAAYLEELARHPPEAEALANDLTLAPIEFFRGDASIRELEQRVIPQIFDRQPTDGGRIRVWSIGCATGEEAYSLAILLAEARARRGSQVQLQVFASDASDRVLQTARVGIYPREIAGTVSPERLERFFVRQGQFLRVSSEIQDLVLFASHNLFMEPPFGHIDLIVCRTLLRDLQPQVRRGMLNLFHYALEPDGALLVGPADEIDTAGLFQAEDGPAPLFRKINSGARDLGLPETMQPFGPDGTRGTIEPPSTAQRRDTAATYRSSIERYAPPGVLIDELNEVIHFSATAGPFVQIPGGVLTHDLTRLVREPIRSELLEGLRVAREGRQSWNSDALFVPTQKGLRRVVLRLERLSAGQVLVVFDDRGWAPSHAASADDAAHTIAVLETELAQTEERLRAVQRSRPDEQRSNSRARLAEAENELRHVLEELASSKEELQTVNEELIALDEENRRRVHELMLMSTDLQHLLASTGVATLFLNREFRIVRFTPSFGELFSLRVSDVGRPLSDLRRLSRYAGFEADARQVLEQVQPLEREVPGPDAHWYLSRLLPYRTEAGRVEGIVLTLIDITERKRAELSLKEASRQKDEFLAVLAHELRNPLAPISSGVEVLRKAPGDSRIVERIAATIGRQTQQLVRLVDDLLEVSRISGGKLRLRNSIIDLRGIIQDALSTTRPTLEKAGHSLRVDVAAEPIWVEGDAVRLAQVLSNLLNNAVRYTPDTGTISVRARREGDRAIVTVGDTGVGIPHEALERVFEMFYQRGNARQGVGAGLGIGLTLAKTLVEMHGGTITAASAGVNGGSEFEVRLPLAAAGPALDSPSTGEEDPTLGVDHRILIVDDNVDAAETLCMLMKSLGEREVHTAASGAQALQTAQALQPDIVFLDLMMPEMDGYEVARRLRRAPWGKDLLLVALSGWSQEDHRRRSKEAGFDRHVTKPADLAALRAVLNGHHRPGEAAS